MAIVTPGDQPPTRHINTGFDSRSALPYFGGFRWLSYTPHRAEAVLALQNQDGSLESLPVTEIWIGGDWKTELPAGGGVTAPLDGLDEFQPWPSQPR